MKQKKLVTVIAAIVDAQQLTLYKEDGNTIIIPQGDPRLSKILTEVMPKFVEGKSCEIDISEDCEYQKFEEQTNGFVKFFRVSREKLSKLFKKEDPTAVANDPNQQELVLEKWQSAVSEIIDNAQPVSDHNFVEVKNEFEDKKSDSKTGDTMVAMVGNQLVTNVEKIKPQISRANATGDSAALEKFLSRLALMTQERSHSVEDLMRFMERGDLPIADDGSIIIYKVLLKDPNKEGRYLDCHSRRVSQTVGSYVCMDDSLVDKNRNNECSSGLHVARRDYVSGFSGDVCVLAKVKPEDVVTVPAYDSNKMRVRGYHILFELPEQCNQLLRNKKSMTSNEQGALLLAKAIKGQHIGVTEIVEITQEMGKGVKITTVNEQPAAQPVQEAEVAPVEAINTDPEVKGAAPTVQPKDIVKAVDKVKKQPNTRQAIALALLERINNAQTKTTFDAAVSELKEHKKKCKVSWANLGLPNDIESLIQEYKAPAAPVKATSDEDDLRPDQKLALKMLRQGDSKAATEKATGISPRSLGRLIDKYGK